ncbi:MAG: phosphoribosylformylglycinamidine cyclo-ligase [Chloroflexi bacterium]|nr:phosphoribosylformylglycinamidine cyclo-ligase [Chloroflexota bacterium]
MDIEAGKRAVALMRAHVRSTWRPEVLSDIGHFGGLFALGSYKEPVLVSSADGVGTKVKVAIAVDRHNTVGTDLVNHCVNDILTLGAEPLFFLDYFATGKLVPEQAEQVVAGLAMGCQANGCALIGGETAEMPDLYAPGDYDLAGFIVGMVGRSAIIDGSRIEVGNRLLGLPSHGLHTNGYSLARKVFAGRPLDQAVPELGHSLGEELLRVHRSYLRQVRALLAKVDVRGMAHITGGGLIDNVGRILPDGVAAHFDATRWKMPPVFRLIQREGQVAWPEMWHVFNMGVGFVLVIPAEQVRIAQVVCPDALDVGELVVREGEVRVAVEPTDL